MTRERMQGNHDVDTSASGGVCAIQCERQLCPHRRQRGGHHGVWGLPICRSGSKPHCPGAPFEQSDAPTSASCSPLPPFPSLPRSILGRHERGSGNVSPTFSPFRIRKIDGLKRCPYSLRGLEGAGAHGEPRLTPSPPCPPSP